MKIIKTATRILILTLLGILAFGPPTQTRAAPSNVEPAQFSCANHTEIAQIECEALVALYNATDGPNWTVQTDWLVTDNYCSWYGVSCRAEGIYAIGSPWSSLPPLLGLRGDLPAEIGDLTNLGELYLSNNQLSSIPAEIGKLTNLKRLYLSNNQLSSIPAEIGNLTNLWELGLSNNQLSSIPAEIFKLTPRGGLNLSNNQLSSLPAEIGKFPNIGDLNLSNNQLSSLPAEIGKFANLGGLNLSNNQLSSLPTELWTLTNLQSLHLSSNQLSNLPDQIGNLTNLSVLSLSSNQLADIPFTITNLGGLSRLSISYNRIVITNSTLHDFISNLSRDWEDTQTVAPNQLKVSGFSTNMIQFTWTPIAYTSDDGHYEISYASSFDGPYTVHGTTASKSSASYIITGLDTNTTYHMRIRIYTPAHSNNPNELWSDYSYIVSSMPLPPIDFDCTAVNEIPQLECEALVALYESTAGQAWSNAEGWVETDTPCSWFGVTCSDGHISMLQLEGSSRSRFGIQSDLPPEIGNLSNLTHLGLAWNQLSSLLAEIGNLNNLTTLDVSDNQLESLPAEIGNLGTLNTLNLYNNQLESLPAEIGNLNDLEILDLYNNQLSSLPAQIGSLSNLTTLNLKENQLSSLPDEIGNLINLTTLDLYNNQLNSLPSSIGNLSSLTMLDLGRSELNDLPAEIGNLTNLTDLNLGSNQLNGVPTTITNLTKLTTLDLAYNRLVVTDDAVWAFLNQHDPDWADTQTTAPTRISATATGPESIQLTWTPIAFQNLNGYYEISIDDGITSTVHGITTGKGDSHYTLEGLSGNTTYNIHIRAYTPAHSQQPKELRSDYSEIVSATTWVPTPTPTSTNTPIPTDTATLIPTDTPTDTPLPTSTPTPTSTNTPIPTDTATPIPTDTPTAIPTNIPAPIGTATSMPRTFSVPAPSDFYEPDNSCDIAQEIDTNGIPQPHTFFQANDEDWTTFTAPSAGTYRIEVTVPDYSPADIDLYYYTECDSVPAEQFVETFSPAVRLDVVADSPGQRFYIQSKNHDPLVAGPEVAYNLSVLELAQLVRDPVNSPIPGPAIVVAGRYRDRDGLQINIDQTALAAYKLFKNKGSKDDNIFFLATDDTLPNVDREATESNLEYGITTWAKEQLSKENVDQVLTLYLVDHGGPDEFYLDRLNQEILTSNDLHLWLTELEEAFPDLLVNVIIEACKAGSFIDPIDGSISKPGRVIIATSNKDYDAYASLYGARFSDNFISYLGQQRNLAYSFQESSNTVQTLNRRQLPWIDADGDGTSNEPNDLSMASLRFIGHLSASSLGSWPPYIAGVEIIGTPGQDEVYLQTEVRHEYDNPHIQAVWGIVYPPDYIEPTGESDYTDEDLLNIQELERIEFAADPDTNALFRSSGQTEFNQTGTYRIAVYARDIDGLEARPIIQEFDVQGTPEYPFYLPVFRR